jgi:RNA polymerase sigma factor (sigma-70 family)
MANENYGILLRLLRRRAGEPLAGGLSDAALLERFVRQRDEAAFEALFWRHGPMVLAVCRRLLPPADAEDAFQATFLVLVRKAASIGRRDAVAAWLYRVAYRVALRARGAARPTVALPPEGPADADDESLAWRDLRPLLDEAIDSLPEKYRAPVVLCYLQGKTNQEAARELGCPKGTLAIRLKRARERLRRRLGRRKLLLPAALLGVLLVRRAQAAAVDAALAQATLKAVLSAAAVSPHAAALAEGVLRAMLLKKIRWAAVLVIALGVIAGGGLWWHGVSADAAPVQADDRPAKAAPAGEGPGKPAAVAEERHDLVDVATPVDGILLAVGSEVIVKPGEDPPPGAVKQEVYSVVIEADPQPKEGDVVPPDWVRLDGKFYRPLKRGEEPRPNPLRIHHTIKWFLPLKEGAKVQEGQVVALIDPELAVDELSIKLAKLTAAEADRIAAEKTRDEARERWKRAEILFQKSSGSREDADAAKFAYERYSYAAISKAEGVTTAARELRQAVTVLDRHTIRSRVRGVVTQVYKHTGEGVKALEPVVQVRLEQQ